jgi:hypothetical protein
MPINSTAPENSFSEKIKCLKEVENSFSRIYVALEIECFTTQDTLRAKELIKSVQFFTINSIMKNYAGPADLSKVTCGATPDNF